MPRAAQKLAESTTHPVVRSGQKALSAFNTF